MLTHFLASARYKDMGTVVEGKVEQGTIAAGDKLFVMPNRVPVEVLNVWLDQDEVSFLVGGENARVKLKVPSPPLSIRARHRSGARENAAPVSRRHARNLGDGKIDARCPQHPSATARDRTFLMRTFFLDMFLLRAATRLCLYASASAVEMETPCSVCRLAQLFGDSKDRSESSNCWIISPFSLLATPQYFISTLLRKSAQLLS